MRCSSPGGRSLAPTSAMRHTAASASTSCSARCGAPSGTTSNASLKIREPMRAQARQSDAHELQRVEPAAPETRAPRDALEKRAVEAGVVRRRCPARRQTRPAATTTPSALGWPASISSVMPVSLRDLQRNRHERIDKRVERRDDLRPAHHRRRDLDDAVAIAVVAGGLDVEHHDLVLEAKPRRLGRARQASRRTRHVRVGTRNEEAMQGGVSHSPRVARGTDREGCYGGCA